MRTSLHKSLAALRSNADSNDPVVSRTTIRAVAAGCFAFALGAIHIPSAHADQIAEHDHAHSSSSRMNISPLVDKVRIATAKYLDINVATKEGWVQATPCVSGPNSGAMGVHFVLPSRLGDGALNGSEPEALIYEPLPSGAWRLVGVEFIALASDWAKAHPEGGTPSIDGHLTNYVGEPNRYGLPAFYEMHVWAWEQNPMGSFSDWNTRVSCENQAAPH